MNLLAASSSDIDAHFQAAYPDRNVLGKKENERKNNITVCGLLTVQAGQPSIRFFHRSRTRALDSMTRY